MSQPKHASSKSPRTRSAKAESAVHAQRAVAEQLERHGVRPSAQRVAIASYVLDTEDHPSADQVWARVQVQFPMVSRATVYNTLRHFTEKGLLRELVLAEGRQVFDPNVEPHHHFVDDDTGAIHDIPWSALRVGKVDELEGLDVREYMVVVRGVKRSAKRG
jgi:Fe2+ or Zn2+ uptake regulation protein